MQLKVALLAKTQGYSIRSLAKATELSYNTVYNAWHNRRWPTKTTLEKIAQVLGVQVRELIEEE